jgi:hypothetical protein
VTVTVENETTTDTSAAPQFGFPIGSDGEVTDIGDCGVPLDAAGTGDSVCEATISIGIPNLGSRTISVDAGSHSGQGTAVTEPI